MRAERIRGERRGVTRGEEGFDNCFNGTATKRALDPGNRRTVAAAVFPSLPRSDRRVQKGSAERGRRVVLTRRRRRVHLKSNSRYDAEKTVHIRVVVSAISRSRAGR